MEQLAKVRIWFKFGKGGLEAAHEYVSLVHESRIDTIRNKGPPDGSMMILATGPYFEYSPANRISVLTED